MGLVSRLVGAVRLVRLVPRLLTPGDSVMERTATGGVWLSLLTVADRVLRLGMFVVLARVLAPADFGLLGLGLLVLAVLRRVSRLGLDEALIQREEADVDAYLDTTWVLTIARGVVIAAVTVAAAPTVAGVFTEPALRTILPVLALSPLLAGLRNPGIIYFRKELAFHRQFAYTLSGTVAQVAVAVAVALVYQNVWALVLGVVAGAAVRTAVSHAIHGYRPGLAFDATAARELLGFGKWIFGSGLVLLALNQGDDALVGWLLGASALGFYQMAFRLSNAPATEVSHVVSKATFPAFSKVQDDVERLREGFFRTVRIVVALAFPMAVGIAVVAPAFVRAALGPDWLPIVDAMRLLALWGALRALVAVVGPLFQATGRPQYSTVLQLSRLAIVAALVYPAALRWGFSGVASVLVASAVVQNPVALAVALRVVDGSPRRFLRAVALPTVAALSMGIVVLATAAALPPLSSLAALCCLVAVGVVTYPLFLILGARALETKLGDDLTVVREALT
ncbi:lipopolysaccharide biosynthesis protein [Halomicroarcula limicola]|uniref:Lipopolysaccharide biosynthesis protein n=1 Tax=Haloarcula limicola TaxID=1429915 RepID=A0A8J8C2A9_9EURY|nr:lipopolysaccharide biosynthesis protein [Halomicroarcula limicola]MBV0923321.1 lipopolysaccharide biosynthesis protein [Halomicroarcula limicola]